MFVSLKIHYIIEVGKPVFSRHNIHIIICKQYLQKFISIPLQSRRVSLAILRRETRAYYIILYIRTLYIYIRLCIIIYMVVMPMTSTEINDDNNSQQCHCWAH